MLGTALLRALPGLSISLTLVFALAPHAAAQDLRCGDVVTAEAMVPPEGEESPLAVGDSPMLLAVPNLTGVGYDVNAHGCRQFSEALELLESYAAEGALPGFVVIALGTNGQITEDDLDAAQAILGEGRVLGLVTQHELDPSETADIEAVRAYAEGHPESVVLMDWVEVSEAHRAWFQPDGVHLTETGALAYTEMLAQGIAEAEALQPDPPGDAGSIAVGASGEEDSGGAPWGFALVAIAVIAATLAILRRRAVVAARGRRPG